MQYLRAPVNVRADWTVYSSIGKPLADIYGSEDAARLIAAAPAMLDALRGIMKWWAESYPPKGADDEMPPHLFDAAHTAIRAALGEPDDDYHPFWHCVDCGREYDDIDDGPCPADDCPSRDDTGDDDGPLEPDEYSDEAADAAEDKWLAARAAPYER